VSVEGPLKAYHASAKPITVQPQNDAAVTSMAVEHGRRAWPSTATARSTAPIDANSRADHLTTVLGHAVQVQATKPKGGALLAGPITLPGTAQGGSGGKSDDSEGRGSQHVLRGCLAGWSGWSSGELSRARRSLGVRLADGGPVTVTVSSATAFDGRVPTLADLVTGRTVRVEGTQQRTGDLLAGRVTAPDDGGNGHPSDPRR